MSNTLFGNDYRVIRLLFRERRGQEVSESFLQEADRQLSHQFRKLTGLEPGTWISLSIPDKPFAGNKEDEQVLALDLFVNGHFNPVTVYWESRDGNCCLPSDPVSYPDLIRYWFGELDTALYVQQLYPGEKLPFRFPYLNFSLTVSQTALDCTLVISFHPGSMAVAEELVEDLHQLVQQLNRNMQSASNAPLQQAEAAVLSSDEKEFVIRLQPADTGWLLLRECLLLLSNRKEVSDVIIR